MADDRNDHVAQPPPAQLRITGMQVTGRVIANFALQHFHAATLFRDHLLRLEAEHAGHQYGAFFESIRCYASACIMSAAASMEALINELFIAHGSVLPRSIERFRD